MTSIWSCASQQRRWGFVLLRVASPPSWPFFAVILSPKDSVAYLSRVWASQEHDGAASERPLLIRSLIYMLHYQQHSRRADLVASL